MDLFSINKQHKRGKLYVTERLNLLFDNGKYQKIEDEKGYDGVLCGYGEIYGKKVYFYAQDFTYMGGTFGLDHSRLIVKTIEQAVAEKCPIIGVFDSGGARIQEGIASVAGCGELFRAIALASGKVPQISIVAGTCAGGAVYAPGLTDFVFVIKEISNMFVTGSRVINKVQNTDYLPEELGGGLMHSEVSGVAHFYEPDEAICFQDVRKLMVMLTNKFVDGPMRLQMHGMLAAAQPDIHQIPALMPEDINAPYDVRKVIDVIVDSGSFFEVSQRFAGNLVTGFATMEGRVVAVLANNTIVNNGAVDCDAADKGCTFMKFCEAFQIPVLTFADAAGFKMAAEEERRGIIKHGASMIAALATSTMPKITVVLRKALGGPYIFMGSKQIGADRSYCWPNTQMAVMGAKGAVAVIYNDDISQLEGVEREDYLAQREKEYEEQHMTSKVALENHFVDEELPIEETRVRICRDLEELIGE